MPQPIILQAGAPWTQEAAAWLHDPGVAAPLACMLLVLFALVELMSLLSKRRALARAAAMDLVFLGALRSTPHVLSIFQDEQRFEGSPRWPVYLSGCRELAYYLVGSDTVDSNFAMRLRTAGRIIPTQMAAVQRETERSCTEAGLEMQQLLLPAPATGALLPWAGLLGATAVLAEAACNAGSAGWTLSLLLLPALAPVVLSVMLSMFLVAAARSHARNVAIEIARLALFPAELAGMMERLFVDHRPATEELPSLASLGEPDSPGFNLPPADNLAHFEK